ncbi:MAG: hypothetical protein KJ906_01885 [Nanoarchaeota archaeon]|nr:hypothetical protein [Nanoarchaeota archaeon]
MHLNQKTNHNDRIIQHIKKSGATVIKDFTKPFDYHDRKDIYIIEADNNAIHILKGKSYELRKTFE